jgi:uncharacterized protein
MRVLIDIGHPAHVHFYKYLISNLLRDGHSLQLTARNKEVSHSLLTAYGIEYINRGDIQKTMLGKAVGIFSVDYKLYTVARQFRPDILMGVHNPYIAHVAKVIGKPAIIFTDTERVGIASWLTFPFADVIWTPSCFQDKINPKKHVTFNGYKELAYLHPRYFQPDPNVLIRAGIGHNEKFIIVRFISWAASHDVNLHGISNEGIDEFIRTLEHFGKVVITSERTLPGNLEKYRLRIKPEDLHSLLHYAALYIGEGGTMATEAAILGTPAVHIESTTGGVASGSFSGNYLELRDIYNMLYFYPDEKSALEKSVEILQNPDSKSNWQKKRDRLIADKIDVTGWMTDFIERYPESFFEYRRFHV